MTSLAIDYAWQHPNPSAIRAAAYVGVLRYLSHDPSKDLSAAERDGLHAAGLGIGVAWETTATRPTQGRTAGMDDARTARTQAHALGYPSSCPIYFAVDENAAWTQVSAYAEGALSVLGSQTGIYGSLAVCVAAARSGIPWRWQTEAWSGTTVSSVAHLYQRVRPTLAIAGAQGTYDEDVVLVDSYPWWTGSPVPPPVKTTPAPVPTPAPAETNPAVIHVTIGHTGCGWTNPGFTVNRVQSVVPVNQSPNKLGRYLTVAQFDGITPEGEMVFVGGTPGTFSYRVWLA